MVRYVGVQCEPRDGNHKRKRRHLSLMKHIYDNERGFEILSFRGNPGSCRGSAAQKHYITTHPRFFPFVCPHRSSEQGRLFVSAMKNDVLTSKLGSSESSRVSLVNAGKVLLRGNPERAELADESFLLSNDGPSILPRESRKVCPWSRLDP